MNRNPLSLRQVIPSVIALMAILDFGSRFLPIGWFSFRAYDPAHRYPLGLGAMIPHYRYDNSRAYGDLAALGNLPAFRIYRREWLTTDGDGFRLNGDGERQGPVDAALIGDSFAQGCSLQDPQTLSAQLEQVSGLRVCNGADFWIDWRRIREYLDHLNMVRGTVILESMERFYLPPAEEMQERPVRHWFRLERQLHIAWRLWKGFFRGGCPLRILADQACRRAENGVILPNPLESNASVRKLRTGQPMVFFPGDIANFGSSRSPALDGVLLLREHLARRGLKLLIVLVPDKYHVYHRLLSDPPPEPSSPGYLDRSEAALRQANIPVVNLEHVLVPAAEKAFARGELIYWPDDTHWNAQGVRVAAKAVAQELIRLQRIM